MILKEPIFFEPEFKEKIWGGQKLRSFGYDIPSPNTGECWAFAAHQNGQSIVKNGVFKGLSLGELWNNNRYLFGGISGVKFPLLTKILDAADDLSVQVHPDDFYANIHGNDSGKTECWYIIDCEDEAEITIGHNGNSKEELIALIENRQWDKLLRKVKVKPGDFFFVPSGTIHAIGKGILILETQQNSDTTYRVYDFDRRDKEGNLRDLHIKQSIEVTTIPSAPPVNNYLYEDFGELKVTTFLQCDFFTVRKWKLEGRKGLDQPFPFILVSVIQGEGTIIKNRNEYFFKKGDHFLLPSNFGEFALSGEAEMIVSHL
ncbi:mannose-6-phosphate isomerase, class I [Neobacillus piezotolerans]|uniref:Mannose-6-phosphate isomerase n=1 Tax=Neobacillus piezotolerans TaxID=2259171 RepID=A0A3D8GSW7_9BACI|nr:mannose-6-phosphate isomerase, class I [Neobacillus piezotolerans]RDU37560.1 mannose-6-phosphate isomerase, class I [Neobacillus piezotolerans]